MTWRRDRDAQLGRLRVGLVLAVVAAILSAIAFGADGQRLFAGLAFIIAMICVAGVAEIDDRRR